MVLKIQQEVMFKFFSTDY